MNTLHPNHTAQIITFPEPQRGLNRIRVKRLARVREVETADLTDTCKNARLREGRKIAWGCAHAARAYWRGRLDFESVVSHAQSRGIAEGKLHPEADETERWMILNKWRASIAAQLLTPAPDVAAVTWKRTALRSGEHKYTDVTTERIARAIADDVAFLAAHPTRKSIAASRQSNSEAIARRREFKEAMRQRIRDVAASRDLSDEEIKPVLKLKHREIAEFTERHGVNLEWLLEGRGRVFKTDPIRLSPEMTAAELATVVRTLPEAKQRTVEAVVDQLLKERGL